MQMNGRHIQALTPLQAAVALLLVTVGCGPPPSAFWTRLVERYGTQAPPPPGSADRVTVFLMGDGEGYFSENYHSLGTLDLGETAVYLALPGFMAAPKAVSIPVAAIGECNRALYSEGYDTYLWVKEVGVDIGLLDHDDRVVGWCEARQIPVVEDRGVLEKYQD